jgi:hypothetical protein
MVKNTRATVRPFVSLMDFRKKFFLVDNPMNILPSMIILKLSPEFVDG